MSKQEFTEYMEKCEAVILEYMGVSSQPFWVEYAQEHKNI